MSTCGQNSTEQTEYKVVVFGTAAVGKTSLIQRFLNGTFKDHYTPTIEDTYRQAVNSNGSICSLIITDTGGSHSFPAMAKLAIQRGNAFILVYAINNRQSFTSLKTYFTEILSIKRALDTTPLIIVGNKCDLTYREVLENEGLNLAKSWKCSYIESSAKQQYNTSQMFEQLLLQEKRQMLTLGAKSKRVKGNKAKPSKQLASSTTNVKSKCSIT
ncbi:DIRAS1 [Bugula neritina]|uniref:DIRAS1 n=1 Tax=Bugula neritina TaxID=10212 RepID=A0A7J7J9L8_BUGNE|nr:DIRAS1 [Bugula neritina]